LTETRTISIRALPGPVEVTMRVVFDGFPALRESITGFPPVAGVQCQWRGARMSPAREESLRVFRVRQLFEVRSSAERTQDGVAVFYEWLEKHYPHLLPSGSGDRLQQLKTDLLGLFKEGSQATTG
jgi:hypothetical protein